MVEVAVSSELSTNRRSTVFEWPKLDELETAPLKMAVEYWQSVRGARLFPSRRELKPRAIASVLPHLALLKVIDGGADFEHRIVGDAQVRAFRVRMQNRRFSEIAAEAPELVSVSKSLFLKVVQTRAPLCWRARTGYDTVDVVFKEVEGVALPLGETDEAVDYVAAFNTYKIGVTPGC
jgi:hypothetical protein